MTFHVIVKAEDKCHLCPSTELWKKPYKLSDSWQCLAETEFSATSCLFGGYHPTLHDVVVFHDS